jgi:multidrug resistance efflux pump
MNPQSQEITQEAPRGKAAPAGRPEEFLQQLLGWKGPTEEFWGFLLQAQCRLTGATAAALFRPAAEGMGVAAVYPARQAEAEAKDWSRFAPAAIDALQNARVVVAPLAGRDDLYGQAPRQCVAVLPLSSPDGAVPLAGAYLISTVEPAERDRAVERLQWSASLLKVAGVGSELDRRAAALGRLQSATETLGAINEHLRFAASAMSLCNELAARWGCERVGLGVLRGRYVRLRALSHTEKFSRKMELVQETEGVMEECLDQDVEVLVPAEANATYGFREAAKFASRHGPACLLSLPLRSEGEAAGVITLERPADKPFSAAEAETLRLTCDLCTPRLLALEKHDRWFGARLVSGLRSAAASAVGATHTGWKLIVLAIVAFILFAVLAKGDFQAEASFFLEADHRQVKAAPFDGELESVSVVPGDQVHAGDALATLKTWDLKLELAKASAERAGYLKQASAALAAAAAGTANKTAEAQIAQNQADGAQAQIDLLDYKICEAKITAPAAGTVLTGDLTKMIGGPVRMGQTLFELAPLDAMRAELLVPEDQIADVHVAMMGSLATASRPEERASFVVERIEPVAEVVNQKNVFRVRARLLNTYPWMRLGLEGVAKIDIDRRSYAWIWTRPLVTWIRMKLWI